MLVDARRLQTNPHRRPIDCLGACFMKTIDEGPDTFRKVSVATVARLGQAYDARHVQQLHSHPFLAGTHRPPLDSAPRFHISVLSSRGSTGFEAIENISRPLTSVY